MMQGIDEALPCGPPFLYRRGKAALLFEPNGALAFVLVVPSFRDGLAVCFKNLLFSSELAEGKHCLRVVVSPGSFGSYLPLAKS